MQFCSVLVARGGDLTNTVLRENVSVPEIGVLIGIHGVDGVQRVPDTTSERSVKHIEEYDRIQNFYGSEATVGILGQRGFNISLPTRLSAVFSDVLEDEQDEDAPPAPKARRGGIKLAPKPEASDEGIDDNDDASV